MDAMAPNGTNDAIHAHTAPTATDEDDRYPRAPLGFFPPTKTTFADYEAFSDHVYTLYFAHPVQTGIIPDGCENRHEDVHRRNRVASTQSDHITLYAVCGDA